jgi:parallel beta-helix repeat protein
VEDFSPDIGDDTIISARSYETRHLLGNRDLAVKTMVLIQLLVAVSIPILATAPATASSYTPHDPIYINGNHSFTSQNGVTGGSGTPSDPYVIEGWEINASTDYGVEIRDTDAHFIIRHVYVHSGGSSYSAIRLFNVTNGRVENATLSDSKYGLEVISSASISVKGNDISLADQAGIYTDDSTDLVIGGNNFFSNYIGIRPTGSTGVSITGNNVTGNDIGIWPTGSTGLNITGNNASSNSAYGIYLYYQADLAVSGNVLLNNADSGIRLSSSTNITLEDNILADNGVGIHLRSSTSIKIRRNTFTSDGVFIEGSFIGDSLEHFNSHVIETNNLVNGKPLYYYKDCGGLNIDAVDVGQLIVANCSDVRLANLSVSYTDVGILVAYSDNVNITGSNASWNGWSGIHLWKTDDAVVTGNGVFSNRYFGIAFEHSTPGTIAGNSASSNKYGLYSRFSNTLTVEANQVKGNEYGIVLVFSTGIRVYHNNLIDNQEQAYDNRGDFNSWDDGYPSGGNYWSNYTGEDNCSGVNQDVCPDPDGIGDTPYVINEDAQDDYPLMEAYPFQEPVSPSNSPPVAAFSITPSSGDVTTLFMVDASSSWDEEDSAEALEVRWDWQDDGVWDTSWSASKTAKHRYDAAGIYAIRLEVRDSAGLTDTVAKDVAVDPDTTPPEITHSPPDGMAMGEGIPVTANVTDANGVEAVLLYYRCVGDAAFQVLTMEWVDGDAYAATIPAQPGAGTVEYHIVATDVAGNEARDPVEGEYAIDVTEEPLSLPLDPVVIAAIVLIVLAVSLLLFLRRRAGPGPQQAPPQPEGVEEDLGTDPTSDASEGGPEGQEAWGQDGGPP